MICLKSAKESKRRFQEKFNGKFIRIDISKNESDEYVLDCHVNTIGDLPTEFGGVKINYCYD